MVWLLIFFLINSFAVGIIAVPRINLNISLICRHILVDGGHIDVRDDIPVVVGGYNKQCMTPEVLAMAALVASRGYLISGILSAIVCPLLGRLSDSWGRLNIIAFTTCGLICSEFTLLALGVFPETINYKWLYLAYALEGLSGSFALIMAMASAYISDCEAEGQRAIQIGRVHGAMFIGIAIGPLLSNALASIGGQAHPLIVFYVCMALRLCAICYLQVVPESLISRSEKAPFTTMLSPASSRSLRSSSSSAHSFLQRISPSRWLERLVPSSPASSTLKRNVIILILINLCVYTGAMATMEVLVLYPQLVYKWGNLENNYFMSVTNAFRAVVATFALPLLIKLFRWRWGNDKPKGRYHHLSPAPNGSASEVQPSGADGLDRLLIQIATLADMAGYIGYALSPSGILFTLCGSLAAFGAIGLSTTEATLTKHIRSDRVGELMGGLGLLQSFVRIVAPSAATLLYSWTAGVVPGLVFWGVGIVLGVGLVATGGLSVDVA